jgi:tripartite-type tricarboxylate transporter receptor subunit TctC
MKTICGVAFLLTLLIAGEASAQTSYPDKQVRILVGFAAGGPADIAARIVAEGLSESLGKPVVVENVTGAAGNVSADRVAKAPPDGYTLTMAASSTIVTNVSLYDKLPFDPVKDLVPISQVCFTPNILALNNDVPAKSVQELVALARARPGELTFGSAGVGTSQCERWRSPRSSARRSCPICQPWRSKGFPASIRPPGSG